MNTKIYVATQKTIEIDLPDCYVPILVGAEIKKELANIGYIKDNEGENISSKNPNYCELTALFWMWRNDKESNVVGLAHYRRFLCYKHLSAKDIIDEYRASQLLKNHDIILPKKVCLYGNVREQYGTGQHLRDYDKCGEVLLKLYPDYYDDFIKISKKDSIYICNMFICKKDLLEKYCKWLFKILFELEKEVSIDSYSTSEKRIYGYLSERLFNVWINHNDLKVFEAKMLKTQEKKKDKIKNAFHLFCYKVLGINVLKHQSRRKRKRENRQNGK